MTGMFSEKRPSQCCCWRFWPFGAPPPAPVGTIYCAYCHGYDGNPLDQRVPRLAGRNADDIVSRILELKAKGTMHDSMRQAFETGDITDQDVENLAAFFSRQPVHR